MTPRPNVCSPDLGICLRAREGVMADGGSLQMLALESIDHKLNHARKADGRLYFFPSHLLSKSRLR